MPTCAIDSIRSHAGCDRITGEVAAIEICFGAKSANAHDVIVVQLQDVIDEAKWILLRNQIENLLGCQASSAHRSIFPPRDRSDAIG